MDSNGSRFVLLNGPHDFRSRQRGCGWSPQAQAYTLTRQDEPRIPQLARDSAMALWREATPYIEDDHGQVGRLSGDRKTLEWALNGPAPASWLPVQAARDEADGPAVSAAALTLDPVDAPAACRFTDLTLGGSGLIALPYSDDLADHGLLLVHLRRRWQTRCALSFAPLRAWVDAQDRIWVLGEQTLALCRGAPLPQAYTPRTDRFEPTQINPDALRVLWQQPLPAHGGLMALAADSEALLWLTLDANNAQRQQLWRRRLSDSPAEPCLDYPLPARLPLITDIAALPLTRVALLAPLEGDATREQRRDCPVVELGASGAGRRHAHLAPERWPRRSEADVRFVRHRDGAVRTWTDAGATPLYALAQARYPHEASAELTLPLDSGAPGVVWHRLYLEACIPPGCSIVVEAQATEVWREKSAQWDEQPAPAWLPIASEIPFAPSAVARSTPEREGLFEILLQRRSGAVRDLAGRYLRLRFTLRGDGRHTPALYALRAWHPRFSWQANYLPGHFHQELPPLSETPVDAVAANAADQRERLLAVFEGLLTPIEDRIAAAETLLHPNAAPTAALPWLAQLMAAPLPAHWPAARQRRWLAAQAQLQRQHGSYSGLCLALDIITDGAVARGEVVPVEMFRLRRTFSTLLGVSMDDSQHPLTLGSGQSGNSLVGPTLVLGEDHARAFLALLAPELAASASDQAVVQDFFDRYARRVTVVLHGAARAQRTLIESVMSALTPAIVQWDIVESDHPFVLGLAPLLQIDTYLERTPAPERVQLDRSRLGLGPLIQNPVALSPQHARLPDIDSEEGARP